MSDYNDLHNFSAPWLDFDAVDSEYPALPAELAQSTAWTAPLHASDGPMGVDTAARLDVEDPAPAKGAQPLR